MESAGRRVGQGSRRRKPLHPLGRGPKIGVRLGCCPARGIARERRAAENRPTEPGRASPGEGSPSSPRRTFSSSARPKTVVIGGGVIGLGIGWRLAQAGCRVAVFERGEAGRGASWAAAGMLAAAIETEPGEEPLLPLTLDSQRLWPGFAASSRRRAACRSSYRGEGTLDRRAQPRRRRGAAPFLRIPARARARARMAERGRGAAARAASASRHRRRGFEPQRPSGREPLPCPRADRRLPRRRGRAARALRGREKS